MKKQLLLIFFSATFLSLTAQVPTYRTLPGGQTAFGMSPSGNFITGINSTGCFVYKTVDSTLTSIGGVEAWGVTDAGVVGGIAQGMAPSGAADVASIYSAGAGWLNLPTVPGGGYVTGTGSYSHIFGIADNGETVCGMYWVTAAKTTAFKYNINTGYTNLQDAGSSARANCISGDGLVVGGWWQAASRVPICWYPGPTGSMVSPYGEMYGTNSTGTYVAGYDNSGFNTIPVLWDRVNGVSLPVPLPTGVTDAQAMAVSDNMVTIGYSGGSFSASGFIYIPGQGTFDLQAYLTSLGATGVGNCGMPLAISRNGRYICGLTGGFPRMSWFVDLGSVPTAAGSLAQTSVSVSAFPNPLSTGTVTLNVESAKSSLADVLIYDLQGSIVRKMDQVQLAGGNNRIAWDLNDAAGVRVPAGSYIATVVTKESRSRTTVIVQ